MSTFGTGRETGPIKWAPSGSASQPRYTRSVQWRHRIAVVPLAVLAGLPVSGAVCAMVCESASSAAATHHGSGQKCEDPAPPPSGPQISGSPEHDCSTHDGAIRQASTTAAERADVTTKSAPTIIGAAAGIRPRMELTMRIHDPDGTMREEPVICRIDTLDEVEYFRHGGILQYVLRSLLRQAA